MGENYHLPTLKDSCSFALSISEYLKSENSYCSSVSVSNWKVSTHSNFQKDSSAQSLIGTLSDNYPWAIHDSQFDLANLQLETIDVNAAQTGGENELVKGFSTPTCAESEMTPDVKMTASAVSMANLLAFQIVNI